ncbi:beach-domain-containing protein [Fistulina hepatica ATCC 64428]|uniref:Beach-domain-containing protein n=1 Tax=Fistulina hepatica ATCC 64428 TaxID=1128425 RepID=A0A0D7ABE8_9AGAR|nr:beach-domain-containing protein [Fistulina hepatica ATCC 64428]
MSTHTQILTNMHSIMLQDGRTKDIFRDTDGFIILTSALSAVQQTENPSALEATRLVFVIMSEAMLENSDNARFFQTRVGYESLAFAIQHLVSDKRTADSTMGYLLSFALQDFSFSAIFSSFRGMPELDVERRIADIEPRLHSIRHPGALKVFWGFIPKFTDGDATFKSAVLKLFERIMLWSHRNLAAMSDLDMVIPVFDLWSQNGNDSETRMLQRILKRLLDMGATASQMRYILSKVVNSDGTLEPDILEVVRASSRSRWPPHFSLVNSGHLVFISDDVKGLPSTGFTFMMWLWMERLPHSSPHPIMVARMSSRTLFSLSVCPDGKLQLGGSGDVVFSKSNIPKSRWVHVVLVHYPHRSSNPNIRLFVDGILQDTLTRSFPRPEASLQTLSYILGDESESAKIDWCIASAFLLSKPVEDDAPRFIHHLGVRYTGYFQDSSLVRYLTYEAATSLNLFLFAPSSRAGTKVRPSDSPLMKIIQEGPQIPRSAFVFDITCPQSKGWSMEGNVMFIDSSTLDITISKLDGPIIGLGLMQLTKTPHELSRSLGIFTDILRNSWQNSDDIERLNGYDILADILRRKAFLINMTTFETMFEFLGVNFRSPEQSTITNTLAYRMIALDFELWSHTRTEIQHVYWEHFAILLDRSRFRAFNVQRFQKLGFVRKILFVLRTDWYQQETVLPILAALRSAMSARFTKEEVVKPVVSYLAATLHDGTASSSPISIVSCVDRSTVREKSEMVLNVLSDLLTTPSFLSKFGVALPVPRVCLLLLGDQPSPPVACAVLNLISLSIKASSSFSRQFELINGWDVLKTVLPFCWDQTVNAAAFNLVYGKPILERNSHSAKVTGHQMVTDDNIVMCPQIVPAIFSALQSGLSSIATGERGLQDLSASKEIMEKLVEALMESHSASPTFRQVLQSHQIIQSFVTTYKSFVEKITTAPENEIDQFMIRLLEKLGHFGMALALDTAVAGEQKREILGALQKAEAVTNPSAERTEIDPVLVADSRTLRQRIASTLSSGGERPVMKTILQTTEWRKNIRMAENKRLRKDLLDLRENRRQVSHMYDWVQRLHSERGLWPSNVFVLWRLDETEGPHRIRKRLERQLSLAPEPTLESSFPIFREIHISEADTQSMSPQETWGNEVSPTDMMVNFADVQLAEEVAEDKHRRVRHELEPGDVIDAVSTVARIAGVDSSPGLLIIGRTHIYILDGIIENDDGEVIDAVDAPKRLFFVPGSIVELHGPQRAQRWSHSEIATFSNKTFLFRDVALELYFKDNRSLLMVFLEQKRRLEIYQRLSAITISNSIAVPTTPGLLKTPLFGKMGARVLSGLRADELSSAQRRWQTREISNFTYLSILNQISGRTPSDATQYPIFPWIISDYTSSSLDLTSEQTFRDLSKPMGALTPERRAAAKMRYENLLSVEETPFHYGTHFSSSMIVCHFLIRLAPFTNMFKTLQGGDWDLPDRLFSDVARAYHSASADIRGDVRELIPEFYTCPEFLENSSKLDFGKQNNGERIDDVKLPPWAHGDPLLFITSNRRALESPYVSEHLAEWIDLIWGYKQRDPESLNCFHPLSYEGAIDLDAITDELEREASVGIIHNFGQTPRKLFSSPHPKRFDTGGFSLPLGMTYGIEEDPHLLTQANLLGEGRSIRYLYFDVIGERVMPSEAGTLFVPYYSHERIEWDPTRNGSELSFLVNDKVQQVVESAYCTCATFADANLLVTGSSDYAVRLWKLARSPMGHQHAGGTASMSVAYVMRTHMQEVVTVCASRAWSLVGYVASCSSVKLRLDTINGRPIAWLDLARHGPIRSLAFHERDYSRLGVLATGGSDGTITLQTWTADGTPEGQVAQWEFITMRTMQTRTPKQGVPSSVTALRFLGESLCHGDSSGRAFMWTLPEQ